MDEEQLWVERQIAWLQGVSPEEWHRVALDFNWGNRLDALYWIVQQPECDRATALTIFWLAQPTAWHLGQPSEAEAIQSSEADAIQSNSPEVKLVRFIAARLHAKGYTRARIAFDATPLMQQDYAELLAAARGSAGGFLQAHPDMKRSIRGAELRLDKAFYARYPEEFHGSVWVDLPASDPKLVTPLMKTARSEVATGIVNLMAIGGITAFLAGHGTPRASNLIGWVAALLAIGLCLTASRSSLQTFRGIVRAEDLEMPHGWIQATTALSLLSGAALGLAYRHVFLGEVQALVGSFGRVATMAVGLLVVVPSLWLVASGAARLLVDRVTFR